MSGWQFWIDRGGTFTDIVARRPDGSLATAKLLSRAPERYADAALAGIRQLLGLGADAAIPADLVDEVRIGTTIGTNALLERNGVPTLLVTTRGFADALTIGTQARPELFARQIVLPAPLHADVLEIDERVDAAGCVLTPLDLQAAAADLIAARAKGFAACAIVLLHGDRFPAHEQALAVLARDAGFAQVSVSHEVSPLIKLVPRGDVTVADAYLSPALASYIAGLRQALGAIPLSFMQSNGGLAPAVRFRGRDSVLSGPAGGLVGAVAAAAALGHRRIVAFDMGGTSTDVAWYDGTFERSTETVVAGVRLATPMLRIHTVAAGGGSICRFDGGRLRVGPESAGADPGPACYRRGGPLTVTDCNLLLGRLDPARFPSLFGPDGDQPLDHAVVERKFTGLAAEILRATGLQRSPRELATDFLGIADATMAAAIRRISLARGHDLDGAAMVCFGGAGGQHACAVADALGIDTILVHPLAGLLSAWGIGAAAETVVRQRSVEQALAGFDLNREVELLAAAARSELGHSDATIRAEVLLKPKGADAPIVLPLDDAAGLAVAFEAAHRQRYGFAPPDTPLWIDAIAVEASLPRVPPFARFVLSDAATVGDDAFRVGRGSLIPGAVRDGPLLVTDDTATTLLADGWRATVADEGSLVLRRRHAGTAEAPAVDMTAFDPARLELFNKAFMAIAEEMGEALRATARSVNIKERLDFSCALFDDQARLIANAPHIPVHLGSMGAAVRAVVQAAGTMRRGQVFATNDPFAGGTHLPDVTVVTPVFLDGDDLPAFFVAARGHHADIGGTTPGSMPADSTSIEQEGIRIGCFELVSDGVFRAGETRALFAAGAWPARDIEQTLGDLRAQIAATETGVRALVALVQRYGRAAVEAQVGHLRGYAAEAVRGLLDRLQDGGFVVRMDSGAEIRVRIQIDRTGRRALFDFSGSSGQRPDNSNAPRAIVGAAVLYALRTLLDDDIPLNEGCLVPIEIRVTPGSMLDPAPPAAVVAGNVETSQAIVDSIFAALGAMAAAQGTMNNVTFGNGRVQYYETICGGAGAGPGFAGADAVHTHMTNSRLTDPEVLETRFPVLVEAFRIRRGSGGQGQWRGGDGIVRRLRFREPVTVSVLANRRREAPFGLAGGLDGARGITRLERAGGSHADLPGTVRFEAAAGDVLVIETPGGGGFGVVPGRGGPR